MHQLRLGGGVVNAPYTCHHCGEDPLLVAKCDSVWKKHSKPGGEAERAALLAWMSEGWAPSEVDHAIRSLADHGYHYNGWPYPDERYTAYAAKFVADNGPLASPTDEALEETFRHCARVPKAEWYPGIRAALATFLADRAES